MNKLCDVRSANYPVEKRCRFPPAIIRFLAVSARLDPSAPPSLAAGFTLRQVNATTRDSDYSGGPPRLDGFSTSHGWLRHRLTAGVLPAYPVCLSCPVAPADPAEMFPRYVTVGWRAMAAFAVRVAARLSVISFEAHWMRFTFVATGQFSLSPAFGFGLTASSQTQLSVVNSPIRPAGLAPAWQPASPAHT